jgi:hypothetical protein
MMVPLLLSARAADAEPKTIKVARASMAFLSIFVLHIQSASLQTDWIESLFIPATGTN